eukprot:FR743632.1.p1 GENE.FR743632.1~~FR743632.1.p1  ORF type:complete len:261 (+),score=37.73 FR743632.1:74-856(+)
MDKASSDLATLKQQVGSKQYGAAQTTLVGIKIALTQFESLPPAPPTTPTAAQERQIACDTFEQAVLLSVGLEDTQSFQRHFAQLKPYYAESAVPPASSCLFNGLNLMLLLVENRLAEFHSELELLTEEERQAEEIAFPIRLEQYLMVGSYNQVLDAKSRLPNSSFEFFMSLLLDTVRDFIAECTEVAYTSLSMDAAQKMMMLQSREELTQFIEEAHDNWVVEGDTIRFTPPPTASKSSEVPSMRLISEALTYATELERIV